LRIAVATLSSAVRTRARTAAILAAVKFAFTELSS
jgi:hypothetical protein